MTEATAPTVSVLMSVHNAQPYIHKSIDSILKQTWADLELIIIDDGSTDSTWAVVADYAARDSRIVPMRNEMNRGTSLALNQGLAQARGDYLTRQDGDDYSAADRLARQVAFLEANPELGAAGTAVMLIEPDDTPIQVAYTINNSDEIEQTLMDYMCLCGPTLMVRRTCFEAAGFYFHGALSFSEDYDLCLRLSEVSMLANLGIPLYYYRQHPASVSRSKRYQQMLNKAIALEQALQRRFGPNVPARYSELVARDYLRAAIIGYTSKERADARHIVDHALELHPWLLRNEPLVEDVVRRYMPQSPIQEVVEYVSAVFDELLPGEPLLKRIRAGLLAQVHMREVFALLERGQADRIPYHLRTAVRQNPRWLSNRGVLSLLLKSWLRPTRESS